MRADKKRSRIWIFMTLVMSLFLSGCSSIGTKYDSISQEEAADIMASGDEYTIVDVRTQEEYGQAHIPGAVLVPIEDIRENKLDLLPDKDRELLLYCRTGRRAEDAAQLLVDAGYSNVKEFGGILTWKGEVEKPQ
jgi:rhodanese-related sulfurtransferase